jgi:divalent metal cation (Fe/Co/Zn/Cd) transporter
VRLVSALSVAWMGIEGAVGVTVGLDTGSIAVLGYGLDSAIQATGGLIVIWRFTGSRIDSDTAERRAQKIVAASFLLFAPYIAAEALRRLLGGDTGGGSWVGVLLATIGIVLMPIFGRAKQHLGAQLGSAATSAEGTQNLLCACLSIAILVGLSAEGTTRVAPTRPDRRADRRRRSHERGHSHLARTTLLRRRVVVLRSASGQQGGAVRWRSGSSRNRW